MCMVIPSVSRGTFTGTFWDRQSQFAEDLEPPSPFMQLGLSHRQRRHTLCLMTLHDLLIEGNHHLAAGLLVEVLVSLCGVFDIHPLLY
jgi:hypothetical protein